MWNDLLRLHWDYLDTEENLQKLEMRKRLEGNELIKKSKLISHFLINLFALSSVIRRIEGISVCCTTRSQILFNRDGTCVKAIDNENG